MDVELIDSSKYHAVIVLLFLAAWYMIGLLVLKAYSWTFPDESLLVIYYGEPCSKSTAIIIFWPFSAIYLLGHLTFTFLPTATIESNKKRLL